MYALLLLVFAIALAQAQNVLDNDLASSELVHEIVQGAWEPRCRETGKALDLVFVLDSSGSLGKQFDEELQVIRDIVNTVVVSSESTRIGLVQYSGTPRTDFHMNTFNQKQQVLDAIDALETSLRGITRTGEALFHSINEFTSETGMRGPDVQKMVFLLSDGRTNDHPKDYQGGQAIRERGIDLYSYGTGKYVAVEELWEITKDKKKVFTQSNYNDLKQFFQQYAGVQRCEDRPVCIPGSDKPVDLLFVIDASGSIKDKWIDEIGFARRVLNLVNVHSEAVRVGLIQYSRVARKEFDFNQYRNNAQLEAALGALVHYRGATDTAQALQEAAKMLRESAGVRDDAVPKVVIVLTDGHSQTPVLDAAKILRKARPKLTVFAVSVTSPLETDSEELRNITADPGLYYDSSTLIQFESRFKEFVSKGCPGGGAIQISAPIVRQPTSISCTDNSVTLRVKTRNPFLGRLYISGHFDDPSCGVTGNGTQTEVELTIVHGTCGLRRQIEDNGPPRVQWKGLAVLQFHPIVMTQADHGVDLSCTRTNPNAAQRVAELTIKSSAARCSYTVRRYSSDGCVALDSRVGDNIYHRWECDNNPDTHAFLVHDCYIESERQTLQVIDKNGCPTEEPLFGMPEYNLKRSNVVTKHVMMFKFPQSNTLKYRCRVTMCSKENGECNNMVPPRCGNQGDSRVKRQVREKIGAFERTPSRTSIPVGFTDNLPSPSTGFTDNLVVETRFVNVLDTEKVRPRKESDNRYCSGLI